MRNYGFCSAPLYYNDIYTGYSLVPNQNVMRFGNNYQTNEYSMRSEPLGDNEYRVLLVGDSVLNGGVQTNQAELASTILEEKMKEQYGSSITPRVLNISCGGWGIDNAYGVIEKYGDFGAGEIVLVFNSHDAVGRIPTTKVAGNSVSFPSEQYQLAWIELIQRYIVPRIQAKLANTRKANLINAANTSQGQENSEGWMHFKEYCESNGIRLVIYLHATQDEMSSGEYDDNGKWIISFAERNNIPILCDLNVLRKTDFRDYIHLNENGQKKLASVLLSEIDNYFSKQ